ncbi:ribonuclease H-like domain-containing protein [Tanacetum coccineum]
MSHQPISPLTPLSPAQHTPVSQPFATTDPTPPLSSAQHDIPPIIIPDPPENLNPISVHPMVTHFCVGSNRPTERLILHVSLVLPLPKSYHDAFYDSNWQIAMCDEYNALIKNQTLTLVPRPPDTNVVRFYMHQPPGDVFVSAYAVEILEELVMVLYSILPLLALISFMLYSRLQFFSSSTTDLIAYSDAYWAGFPTTRRSTSGYCVFLGNNLLSWSSKRQPMLSCSSAEAKYRSDTNVVAETCWLRNLLRELHYPLSYATIAYCDNVSAMYLSSNPVQH